jgi:hypothetical protein
MVGSGAAPADMPRKHISGRPRVAVRSNYVGLPLMAGRGTDEGRRKLPGSGRAECPPSVPGSTAPRTEIAAVERREACASIARRAPRLIRRGLFDAPFGAPLPSCVREQRRDDGVARAATTGPAELWLFDIASAQNIPPHPEEREAPLEGGQRPDRPRVYPEIGTMSAQVGYSRLALFETRRCAALIP